MFNQVIFKPFGRLAPETVSAFSRESRLVLPQEYVDFLLSTNGGIFESASLFVSGANEEVLVEVMLGLGLKEKAFNCNYWLDTYRSEMPTGFLVIALGSTGKVILGTEDPNNGVFFWDNAHDLARSKKGPGNTYKLSATFAEFARLLVPLKAR